MTQNRLAGSGQGIETSRALAAVLIAALALVLVSHALRYPVPGAGGRITDFDAFYLVGQMVWQGEAALAYDPEMMRARQQALTGGEGFMPWTYPPPFDLLVMLLPLAGRGVAYALFTGATMALYLVVLARLARGYLTAVLLAIYPVMLVMLASGQNGFLTGALAGAFALASLRGRAGLAGLALGGLAIKPHLGVALAVQALSARRWGLVAVAVAAALAGAILATLVLGPAIWSAFRDGAAQTGDLLAEGFYPLHRMTTVFAALLAAGVPVRAALVLHGVVAIAACGLVGVMAARGRTPLRHSLGAACLVAPMLSPYAYDYDLTLFGAGLALLAADLVARTAPATRLGLLALAWVAGGAGYAQSLVATGFAAVGPAAAGTAGLALGGIAYPVLVGLCLFLLGRVPPPRQAGGADG